MCAVKLSHAMRVKRSLERELPACHFDDTVVEYLAQALDGVEVVTEDILVEEWFPYLIAANACMDGDDEDVRGVCRGLLAHLKSEEGDDGFEEAFDIWMKELSIDQYANAAREWCATNGVRHLDTVKQRWKELSDHLGLRTLERRRVEKYVTNGVVPKHAPQPQKVPKQPDAVPAPRCPQFFGPSEDPKRYKQLEELGQGATARVHKCVSGEKTFAVKTISLSHLRLQPDYKRVNDRLQKEISILCSLQHQRIVSLRDVVEYADVALHLVLELVKGGTLFDRIVEHRCFAEAPAGLKPLAGPVFAQIADALRYIHSKDIIHRDLKPDNVLVDETTSQGNLLEVKLSDFGHSKLINDGYSVARTAGIGTPQYFAPEVADPRKAALGYDQRVDLWSLGIVMYVMLIGAYPFNERENIEEQVKKAQLSFINKEGVDISAHAKNLICSLLKVDPRARLSLDHCLSHSWLGPSRNSVDYFAPQEDPVAPEVRLKLPIQPTKQKVQQIRTALISWEKKFCYSATIKHKEIIVCFSDMDGRRQADARQDLLRLLEEYFPGASFGTGDG